MFCVFVCVFVFVKSCGIFRVYYNSVVSVTEPLGLLYPSRFPYSVWPFTILDCSFCTCLFSVRVSPFLVPLYPRPCVPSTTIQSLAGILQCTCLVSVRMLCFPVLQFPCPCVPSTEIQPLAGILQCTCLFLVRMLRFLEPFPCVSALSYISAFCVALSLTVGPRITPTRSVLASITRCGLVYNLISCRRFK